MFFTFALSFCVSSVFTLEKKTFIAWFIATVHAEVIHIQKSPLKEQFIDVSS
jgi:hypothetical protein